MTRRKGRKAATEQRAPRNVSPSSKECLEAAASGDPEAIERWIRECTPRVVRRIRRRIGSKLRRHIDAEDLVQEAWLSGWVQGKARGRTDMSTFANWLTISCENRLRSVARREQLVQPIAPPREASPPSKHDSDWDWDRLRKALGSLTPDQQSVVCLRHWFDLPWRSIADILGRRTAHAAEMLHHRALARLRQILSAAEGRKG